MASGGARNRSGPQPDPAIPELRQQQAALGRFLGQLDLEDEDEQVLVKARQLRAHAEAQARWRDRRQASNG